MAINNPLKPAPASADHKTIPAWVFFVGIAAVLVIGAIIVGYLRSKSSSANTSTANPSTAATTPTVIQAQSNVDTNAFDALELAYGTQYNQLQQSNVNAQALQSQIATLQSQLTTAQQQGKDITALQAQIAALQAQLKNIPAGPPGPPGPAGPPGLSHPPIPAPPPPQGNSRTHTVHAWPAQDSTLWGIAQQEYGNGALWPRIAAANPWIKDPNLIQPGWTLKIPAA